MEATPWFVGGGAQHSPEVARLLAYAGTGGAGGIVEPGGLKVAALAVPGTSVRVLPGAAVLVNRYAGGGQQSYLVRSAVEEQVPVTATGSSGGRSDLVVARVLDPQYEGAAPSAPSTFQYARVAVIQGVAASVIASAAAAQAYCAALPYPAEPLAGITLPASTATVTAAMVADLRTLARPRTERVLRPVVPAANADCSASSMSPWLTAGMPLLSIPRWATHVDLSVTLSQLVAVGEGFGAATVRVGSLVSTDLGWDTAGTTERFTMIVSGAFAVPEAMRGTSVRVDLYGRRDSGSGLVRIVGGSQVVVDAQFSERAV